MMVGLVGSPRSPDLCLVKKRIEDRGHRAVFLNIREFPQYALSGFGQSSLRFDHLDLLEFDSFYLNEIEARNRFFRGIFDNDIWMTLRERYIDFAEAERHSLTYQIGLLTALSCRKPFINSPVNFLKASLRASTLFRLAAAGLPAAEIVVAAGGTQRDSTYMRLRLAEDEAYDVPCFPRNLEGCVGLVVNNAEEQARVIGVRGERPSRMVVATGGKVRAESTDETTAGLTEEVLGALHLETAEVCLARGAGGIRITEVLPAPHLAEFEEMTGESISEKVAERLLSIGGSP
jgi:hypothetical protein